MCMPRPKAPIPTFLSALDPALSLEGLPAPQAPARKPATGSTGHIHRHRGLAFLSLDLGAYLRYFFEPL